ncbi:MAG: trypsin-like peptidase domain-containing protein [Treponema sp.]|nr:trypsin-like peptidase domain-containing protein [Treponema sp.]
MKKLISALLSLSFAASLSAQVKNYVGIVREKYYPAQEEFLGELSSSLKSRGYASYSEYIDSYLKGGFGSGFVYVDKDGTNYVITNRHVVSQAASASIEFENEDGSTTKYENLSVLITDDDIDLAILKFEGSAKPFKRGLTFSSAKLSDGQNVVSAGFPALGNEPVWQFGKGSVTNASARIKDLIDPAVSTVIQHSAQIDGGNSGGPLLIESKTFAIGYEVVGVNTWKAVGRDSTNFSIPARLALDLIEKSRKTSDDSTVKAARAAKFKAALTESENDYTSIVKFISYDYASAYGEAEFEEILRHGSTKVRNRVVEEFAYDPIEGLRYAVAYNLYNNYSGENATDENLSKIVWSKEHGLYRISSTGEDKKDKKDSKVSSSGSKKSSSSKTKKSSSKKELPSVSFEGLKKPYFLALYAGGIFPLENNGKNTEIKGGFDFSADFYTGENGIFGLFLEYTGTSLESEKINAFGGGIAIRLPFNFGLFSLCPRAATGIQLGSGDIEVSRFFWKAGAEVVFDLGLQNIRPCISAAYRKNYDKYTDYETFSDEETLNSSNIVFKVGIAFSLD